MNKCSSILIQRLRTWLGARQKEATDVDLLLSSLFFSIISIAGGTALYSSQEGWTYFESCYYCFITLTTIGFGDFVALQQDRSLTLRPGYVVARWIIHTNIPLSIVFSAFAFCCGASQLWPLLWTCWFWSSWPSHWRRKSRGRMSSMRWELTWSLLRKRL